MYSLWLNIWEQYLMKLTIKVCRIMDNPITIMKWFSSSWFYLIGKVRYVCIAVNCESQSKDDDVGKWGNNTQHHSIPQLEWQHGVRSENDEEEQRHLEKKKISINVICLAITL